MDTQTQTLMDLLQKKKKHQEQNAATETDCHLFKICITYFVNAIAMAIPQSILTSLSENSAGYIRKNQRIGAYKIETYYDLTMPECLAFRYLGLKSIIADNKNISMELDEKIQQAEQQLTEIIVASSIFPIMGLPTDLFAYIAQYLPTYYRRISRAFRKYIPVRDAKINPKNAIEICHSPINIHTALPVRIIITIVTDHTIAAAKHIAQKRQLSLHLKNSSATHTPSDLTLLPSQLYLSGSARIDFIKVDQLQFINLSDSDYIRYALANLQRKLNNDSPLRQINVYEHVAMPRADESRSIRYNHCIFLRSAGPITMLEKTLRALVHINVHFLHPPIVPNMTSNKYRRLRCAATTPNYKLADVKLTGRTKFAMCVPQHKYVNQDWSELTFLPKSR